MMKNPMDATTILDRCQCDPLFFSEHILGGEQPWARQCDIMRSVRDYPRIVVPSGFAVGKTWVAARIALWFLFSFPHSLVITTAPTWRQVENILWAEIRRQHTESARPLGGTVIRTQIKITDNWFAIGMSTDDPTRFQGFHSAHLLLVFDEAAGIDRTVWDAAEGQMASAHARWLAIGNPVAPSGPFYDACKGELWHTIPTSCLDTPNVTEGRVAYPKLVTSQWVEDRKREWGEESPLYQSRVLGQFPTASEHGLIPLAWILEANKAAVDLPEHKTLQDDERKVGVDVARSGADATVFLLREGNVVSEIEEHHQLSTTESTGKLIQFVERLSVQWHNVYIDVIGIGAGVVDRLREQDRGVCAVNFGAGAVQSERYANARAECYWGVRDALRLADESRLRIPAKFGRLCSELVSVEWSATSSGKILIEPKEAVKKRIGRSPDHADALALSYARSGSAFHVFIPGLVDEDDGKPWLRIDNDALWT